MFNNGDRISINANMCCNAKFCIYLLQCLKCHHQYIGETNDFRLRINLHKDQIKKLEYRKLEVSKHIFKCGGKFKALPFFQMRNSDLLERQLKEIHFIERFKPELNR